MELRTTKTLAIGFLLLILSVFPNHANANNLSQFTVVPNTDVAAAGVGGMRNQGTGTITLSGVSGTVTKAYLYWHGPTNSTDPAVNANVFVNAQPVTGTHIGFSDDNNWAFDNSQAYRADVTALVTTTGNGNYALTGFKMDENSVSGGANTNGASLIVFFNDGNNSNNRDAYLFDGNDSNSSNSFDANEWNATLSNINYASGATSIQLHVADGQTFDDGDVLLNGTVIATGPIFEGNSVPSLNNGPDNNGNLWDIKSFDIATFLSPGSNTLTLTNLRASDALGLIAVLVSVPALDQDGDGVANGIDNCPTTFNPDQTDVCHGVHGPGDPAFQEAQVIPIPPLTPGAPYWVTATFTYSGTTPIYTQQPTCFNTTFTLKQGSTLILPRILEGTLDWPNDFIVINPGASFSVTCDLSERYIASRLPPGSYSLLANYANDVNPASVEPGFGPPPGTTLFLGRVNAEPVTVTVSGTPVTQTSASVVYNPSAWSTQWATLGSPTNVVAHITLTPGGTCTGFDSTKPITMNGVAGAYIGGSITSTDALASFTGGAAVQSLGTTSPGTYNVTVQGSCGIGSPAGALFTAQATITLGLKVSIDIRPLSGANRINACLRLPVPVAIFSTATFDATKVLPDSITLAGGSVGSIRGHSLSTTLLDLNRDGRRDMLVLIDTRTMTLNPAMTSAVLEGVYVKNLGNGNTPNVPIYGQDAVTILTRCSDKE